ncbi:MAG: patatin-like phospholipase family protein [Candidatus Bipolaricaulota bacterium]|nr:patatin-like phospholipase family protein [Candidatus Bipolaricaulota bacterium]MCX7843966.1 patatin-like phospholipase family protein [Candidatus Bipolaricaulota bacterium]MDW8151721.1 patatin-like phospholipase family protein [Candidatus Bipolaricaulota bacterium]
MFALVLGGGGARGLAHLGFLLELEEHGLRPQLVAGTSMGAIVGGFYCAGQDLAKTCRVLAHLDLFSFFGLPRSYRAVVEQAAVASLLEKLRGRPWWELTAQRNARFLAFLRLFTKGQRFEELSPPLVAVACDLHRGEEVRLSVGPAYLGIGASAALPGLLGPIRWRDRWLIDGGVVNNLPIEAVADRAERVVAVDVAAPLGPPPTTLVEVVLRAYDITSRALQEHQIARARERLGERLLLVRPELPSLGLLDFHRLPEAVEAGRAAAQAVLSELRA